jgi:hypothetical protein
MQQCNNSVRRVLQQREGKRERAREKERKRKRERAREREREKERPLAWWSLPAESILCISIYCTGVVLVPSP